MAAFLGHHRGPSGRQLTRNEPSLVGISQCSPRKSARRSSRYSNDQKQPRRVPQAAQFPTLSSKDEWEGKSVEASTTEPAAATVSIEEADKPTFEAPGFLNKFWRNYTKLLDKRPILVKSLTSLVGFMLGDILAQALGGNPYRVMRTVRLTLFGIFMDGPIGHVWYSTLDKYVYADKPTAKRAVLAKTALDQLVWAPFFTTVFFTFMCSLEGRPDKALSSIQQKLIPVLLTNYAVWPLAHIINFRFVPSSQRILYVNFCQIMWSAYLSTTQAKPGR